MDFRRSKNRVLTWLLLAGFGLLILGGCYASRNRVVPADDRISLVMKKGMSGVWETDDLLIDYQYSMQGKDRMKISGAVEIFGRIRDNFPILTRFSLQLYLIDRQGEVIGNRALATAAHQKPVDPIRFEKSVEVPENAAGFTFGYTGRAEGGTDDDGNVYWDFWETPLGN